MDESERKFRTLMEQSGREVDYPSVSQDKYEHWDIKVDGSRIEVKGRKTTYVKDIQFRDDYLVETLGVKNYPGWIYGKADYIAFERIDDFICVPRLSIIELLDKKLKDGVFGVGYYETYVRKDDKEHPEPHGHRGHMVWLPPTDIEAIQGCYYVQK